MKQFLLFTWLTSTTTLVWVLLYSLYLIHFQNVPTDYVLSPKTSDPILNNSVFHWKQKALTFDTIIIGSSMALNNFDPSYYHSESIGVFGAWGLMPHKAIEAFSEAVSNDKKHFLVPLSLPEAATNENISNLQNPDFSWRLTRHDEWAHLESLRKDRLKYTNLRLEHNGNAPLSTISEGFQIAPERWDFIYSIDTTNLNIIVDHFNQKNCDATFLILPWRDSSSYPLMTEWINTKIKSQDKFIDLRKTQIAQASWLDGTHLDHDGARALFAELRRKLHEANVDATSIN